MGNTQEQESYTEWQCYINATGIKKRCRKVDHHQLDLGVFPIDTPYGTIIEKAKAEVKAKMKTLRGQPCVKLCHFTIKGTMSTWEPFSGRDKKFPLEVAL